MVSMKAAAFAAIVAIVAFAGTPVAFADMWVDYAPTKEPWDVTSVKVEASKLDDYIISLNKSYVPSLERQKRTGDVVEYHILVNATPNAAGATVVFITRYKDWSALAPNRERDLKEMEDSRKSMSKNDEQKLGEDRSKFRTFLDEGVFGEVTYLK